jgi:membrane protein YdbS with pleckstrin-like domain
MMSLLQGSAPQTPQFKVGSIACTLLWIVSAVWLIGALLYWAIAWCEGRPSWWSIGSFIAMAITPGIAGVVAAPVFARRDVTCVVLSCGTVVLSLPLLAMLLESVF